MVVVCDVVCMTQSIARCIDTSENSSVSSLLKKFKSTIELRKIWYPKDDIDFVFLCGANINNTGEPSKRRQNLIDFSKIHLPDTKFFLAEKIFEVLTSI